MSRFSFSVRSPNGVLRYAVSGKTYSAGVRVSKATYTYGVRSTESHSRLSRAFYPHRRALGEFQITVDSMGYREYKIFMNWIMGYSDALLTQAMGTAKGAVLMEVQLPSRRFHKYGILTSGMDDHDQVGSMLFQTPLTFMTLKDFNDPGTALVKTESVSSFHLPSVSDDQTLAFYPVSVSSYKDTDDNIYNAPPQPGRPGPGGGVGFE